MIELKGVSKSFHDQQVVAPLDWRLRRGATHVLIGPSGCGKSTILRMLIGLITPTSGSILFENKPVASHEWLKLRRRMGYVIQDGGLFPHLTARENVVLMARRLGWPRVEREERLTELAELTHFPTDGLDRYPAQLSGGQRQRVGIMRALMLDPVLILLDEPLGALDPLIRFNLQTDLREIFQTLRKTVVLVTHDVGEAKYFGDEISLLRRGRVVQRGTFSDLIQSPAEPYVGEFISAQRSFDSEIEACR